MIVCLKSECDHYLRVEKGVVMFCQSYIHLGIFEQGKNL